MPGSSSPTRADCRVGSTWREKEAARGGARASPPVPKTVPDRRSRARPLAGLPLRGGPNEASPKAGRRQPPPRTATSGSAQAGARFRGVLRHVGCGRLGPRQAPTRQPRDTDLEPVRRASPRRGSSTERQSRGRRPPMGASSSVAARIFRRFSSSGGWRRRTVRRAPQSVAGRRDSRASRSCSDQSDEDRGSSGALLGDRGRSRARPPRQRVSRSCGGGDTSPSFVAVEGDGRLGRRSWKERRSSKRLRGCSSARRRTWAARSVGYRWQSGVRLPHRWSGGPAGLPSTGARASTRGSAVTRLHRRRSRCFELIFENSLVSSFAALSPAAPSRSCQGSARATTLLRNAVDAVVRRISGSESGAGHSARLDPFRALWRASRKSRVVG